MNALADFHFLRPLCLLALLPFGFVCWRLFRRGDAAGVWQSVCDDALLPYLLVPRTAVHSRLNPALFLLVGAIAIVALAGPTWERLPTPVFRDESALVLLLDLSRSMNAEDVSPTRLERAKFKITDMLRQRRDGQTALVVYAAEPYVVAPLTTDVATIESHLPALKTNIMPSQGSDAAAAIEKGLELLQQAGNTGGDLILITDGVGLDDGQRARTAVAGSAARLSILGVGTPDGAPIPDPSGGFVTDAAGAIVVNALDTAALEALAAAGGGRYATLRTDDGDVAQLLADLSAHRDERNARATDLFADRWREFGPWLLLGLLPFVPLAFRRGILTCAGFALSLSLVPAAPATAGWWQTPDQAAQAEFDAGNYAAAADQFEDPRWRAAARYRANDYAGVIESLGEDPDPEALYNKGNALARLGEFEDAIAAYDDTLAARPDHADARHNKELLEKLLAEQQQQQKQDDSESQDDSDSEDQSGESGGDRSDQRSDAKPSEDEAEDSAQTDPGADEQSASSTSSEQESPAEAEPQAPEDTAKEQQAEAEEAPAEEAEDAFAAANSELENEQATEQWLRQIPDDPGGLLRRKFEAEYQRKHGGERRSRAW